MGPIGSRPGVSLSARSGSFTPASSTKFATIGAAFYADATAPLVVLVIDTDLLNAPVVVENLDGGDEGFPHIYGPLPTTAVVDVRRAGMMEGTFHVQEGRDA